MIDSHCHLNDDMFAGEEDIIINNYLKAGVSTVICIGCNTKTNNQAKRLANNNKSVYYTVGYHPDDIADFNIEKLEKFFVEKDNKLVALGEIGLDYFHNKENKLDQIEMFEKQIQLAKKYNMPIVVHCREAYQDTYETLKKYAPYDQGVVMHCYSGSWEFAKQLLKLGIKFSFTGTVTYKNAKNVQEVAQNLPDESFFFETDSPYLSPTGFRGKRNEPKNVIEVAKFVAELRGVSFNTTVEQTDKNAKQFFKIK